ncbi:MAG TPA: hypothetical protein VKR99_06685, partial [Candidatus Eremiobacteraceae bacterium]|nr:hypothetical protein [Candidatus Eremiobacteraceae bacterium]
LTRAYDLPPATYAFSLYLERLPQYAPVRVYEPLPRFPGTTRDIALVVEQGVNAGELASAARQSGAAYLIDVEAFDEYRGKQVGDGKKSIAFRIVLRRPDATITDDEANASTAVIVAALKRQFGATLRD